MKSELKAKFLNHLISKKREGGFTLIELLVVIIIIGILSAIALPSFLNQANKGKQSEAKTYVGTLNRTQQSFYLEKTRFAKGLEQMANPVPKQTPNYDYASGDDVATSATQVLTTGTSRVAALRSYGGTVFVVTDPTTTETTTLGIAYESDVPTTNPLGLATINPANNAMTPPAKSSAMN
ncbi:type IV pilin-like G/H family protein [Leptolyngbya sp. NIES-2104]|uniref:type IV pilin-like G/H family protein n=1 Tax=Leptolyngbya sp. NIES-2104 TaxID=1552121 RepID=UPI0006EC431B|nr:type IV pilin-like G/H family protein [Leptolyngbya sp. NIES-2104]GAP93933.1 type IV pilin PilA [Leptolyngbya sp. NIES-2104]